MAINKYIFDLIKHYGSGGSVLSAGYPDALVTKEEIVELCSDGSPTLMIRDDSEAVKRRHGSSLPVIYETGAIFMAMGYKKFTAIDIETFHGEQYIDLNVPQHLPYSDLVLDCGTIEHCFNIGQALMNLISAVKTSGVIIHDSPLNMFNHGFYNLNPTLFASFYEQNGFEILQLTMRSEGKKIPIDVGHHIRFSDSGYGAMLTCVARRTEHKFPKYPVQEKYRKKF